LGIEGGGIAIADRAEVTTGDEIFNPRTGQRMAFPRTAADSGGEDLIIECWSPPEPSAAAREPLHVHPEQTKVLRVINGELSVFMEGQTRTLAAGEEIAVPPGAVHSFWNAGDREVHYWQEFRPALRSAEFFATLFALARDGKLNERGIPGILQLSVTIPRFRREIRVVRPPAWAQRLVSLLAPIARLTGREAERQ